MVPLLLRWHGPSTNPTYCFVLLWEVAILASVLGQLVQPVQPILGQGNHDQARKLPWFIHAILPQLLQPSTLINLSLRATSQSLATFARPSGQLVILGWTKGITQFTLPSLNIHNHLSLRTTQASSESLDQSPPFPSSPIHFLDSHTQPCQRMEVYYNQVSLQPFLDLIGDHYMFLM